MEDVTQYFYLITPQVETYVVLAVSLFLDDFTKQLRSKCFSMMKSVRRRLHNKAIFALFRAS